MLFVEEHRNLTTCKYKSLFTECNETQICNLSKVLTSSGKCLKSGFFGSSFGQNIFLRHLFLVASFI